MKKKSNNQENKKHRQIKKHNNLSPKDPLKILKKLLLEIQLKWKDLSRIEKEPSGKDNNCVHGKIKAMIIIKDSFDYEAKIFNQKQYLFFTFLQPFAYSSSDSK